MKASEAPEKIYILNHKDYLDRRRLNAFTEREDNSDIEYTRTDAFIEKACKWLGPVFKGLSGYYSGAELLDDFKNYMKGE